MNGGAAEGKLPCVLSLFPGLEALLNGVLILCIVNGGITVGFRVSS